MTLDATLSAPARPEVQSRSGFALPVLFSFTAFVGAALLFLVEPMVAKLLLPSYGGAATVWATSTLFFQLILLLAYLFVHVTSRFGHRRQPLSQLPLVLLALVVLPLTLPEDAAPDTGDPILWLLRTLLLMVGLPFAVLATTGPLLQRWYAWTDAPRAEDPYFLYAASNVGSFVGLLAYPFLVEPRLTLADQRTLWSWAFAAFVLLVAACGTIATTRGRANHEDQQGPHEKLGRGRVLRWVALAFLPSSLMLGATTHISTDVAAIPLLWVVPLAIYLATMVAAFAGHHRTRPARASQLAVVAALVAAAASFLTPKIGIPTAICIDLVMLALVGYAAHGQLASDRPSTVDLTRFYVAVSVGGALGGLLNGVLAPSLLDRPIEFPVVLAAVPLVLSRAGGARVVAIALATASLATTALALDQGSSGLVLERSRTFYGSYVVERQAGHHQLEHGTTLHGIQFVDPRRRREPTTYYARSGPLGDVFEAGDGRFDEVAAVGLGAGTVAAYGEAGQRMTFVEIDPAVIRLARDRRLFTYLADSAADVHTVAGDGRLQLESMDPGSLDLVLLDAFSSDAIPVHLLTREAIGSYARQLAGDGVLAVHITNRLFDLSPVLADAAHLLGWRAVTDFGGGTVPGSTPARWVVLTPDEEYADTLVDSHGWAEVETSRTVRWTDDYSSVLDVLK